ncbi:Pentatricopeptide repeat [Macleaya cordata]|uniref:Pentatricopeptide repeat n=1 Tax=Macleaya cordata TaxID=56857 RepID=A0A200PUX6_MACCD|nr:Pentatricopeptide repeat [Macleaya cordata]
MSFIATTTTPTTFWFSTTPHQSQRKNLLTKQNGSLPLKPFSKISIFSSNFNSSTSITASTLLQNTINQDRIDCNTDIRRLCEVGDLKNAMNLLCNSPVSQLELKTLCLILQLCAEHKSLKDGSLVEGQEAHGYLLRLGYGSYNTVGNSLIAFYSKCKKIENAHKVFDELSDRDVISWNSIVCGYVSNGLAKQGLEIFSEMMLSGVNVDLATMVIVLPACAEMGLLLFGRALHGYAIKSQHFSNEITLHNTLLDMYAKCGDLGSAICVFGKIGKKSVVSWTSMITGYTREGKFDKAIGLFSEMEAEGIKPDLFTVTSILHACACNGSLESGKNVHDYILRNNLKTNIFVANALMDMYAKCGDMTESQLVFDQMLRRDLISWNTIIGGYSKNCLPNEAFGLFLEMQSGFNPNCVTISCILPACSSLSALERGREIHGYALRNGFISDRYITNALVDMYAKCGALPIARLLFNRLTEKDLVSWTVMITGHGMHGCGREAIAIFNEMRKEGIKPDGISFIAILYACSHSGLLDEGLRFFNIMRNDCKIEPKLEHYACMVDLLACAGRLTKAYKFIKTMPIEADSTVWGALLCGCRIHRDVKLAEIVAEKVFELEPENTGYYVLLANIYAEAEKWEEVKKLRERISRRGLRKSPGCSWIEINKKVHIFVARDRSNPQYKKIELFLERVRMRMKEEGCFPDKRYALVNAGDMEKEEALCGHSEKLAMAFGILSLPPGKTVRVTKNLRVCGDCHEVAKFMSKMVGKEIVLRDSNRFHHFKDGRCSCRGYW